LFLHNVLKRAFNKKSSHHVEFRLLGTKKVAKTEKRHNLPELTSGNVHIHIPERRQIMADLHVTSQDGMYHIRSQDFCIQFPDTEKNTRVLWLLLRSLHESDSGKPLFTYEQIAKAFGYKARQNIQNFEQEFNKCGGDLLAYLQRKCKVDALVVTAVSDVLGQHPLASATTLCPLVSERLGRTDLTPANIRTALHKVPCSVIRPGLQRQWEQGSFHPKEEVVLEEALAALLESPSSSPCSSVAEDLLALGITAAESDETQAVQRQQTEAAPVLLNVRASLSELPVKIRLMVVAFSLYYWNVPLSRIALWMNVSPSTVLNWTTGLAVAVYPLLQVWIVTRVEARCVAVDEKWLKIRKTWHYWFVTVDEATGLPVAMALLHTRTTWACCWFLLTLKRLGVRPRSMITDGLAGYGSSIRTLFPSVTHVLCLFHHQQGVTRWLRDHAASLPKEVVAKLKHKMKRVVQTCDPRTVRRRLARLLTEDGAQECGLEKWVSQTHEKLDRLEPALRQNSYPRTTNGIERFFRAFQRFYKTRGGFHSFMSAKREVMVFVVGYLFTIQPGTGIAPIEQIVSQASLMPFYQIVNEPFSSGLVHICQAKLVTGKNMACRQASRQLENP
jgi:transposase-like protein